MRLKIGDNFDPVSRIRNKRPKDTSRQNRRTEDGEWENDVKLYEDYLCEEDSLFDTGNKVYSRRASLLTELNRINEILKEIKGKCEMRDDESAPEEGKRKAWKN
uniref:Uncharacterized protein n=1 Tax=Onchocerca volvulus TaxID=6282 RepID=A0A8R1XN28_ONCVO